jgi:hypothetical protein
MSNVELCFLSITALADHIRRRDISPVEAVEALLERIETHNDTLIAYLYVDRDNGCVPPFTHGVSPRPVRLMKPGVIRAVPDVRFHASSEPPCR